MSDNFQVNKQFAKFKGKDVLIGLKNNKLFSIFLFHFFQCYFFYYSNFNLFSLSDNLIFQILVSIITNYFFF